jgi:hypothetical protein
VLDVPGQGVIPRHHRPVDVLEPRTVGVAHCQFQQHALILHHRPVAYDIKRKGPDGKPFLVDDAAGSGRARARYINQAEAWKWTDADVLVI